MPRESVQKMPQSLGRSAKQKVSVFHAFDALLSFKCFWYFKQEIWVVKWLANVVKGLIGRGPCLVACPHLVNHARKQMRCKFIEGISSMAQCPISKNKCLNVDLYCFFIFMWNAKSAVSVPICFIIIISNLAFLSLSRIPMPVLSPYPTNATSMRIGDRMNEWTFMCFIISC